MSNPDLDKLLKELQGKSQEIKEGQTGFETPSSDVESRFNPKSEDIIFSKDKPKEPIEVPTVNEVELVGFNKPVEVVFPTVDEIKVDTSTQESVSIKIPSTRRQQTMDKMHRILEAYGGIVSNIPITSDYYRLKNSL